MKNIPIDTSRKNQDEGNGKASQVEAEGWCVAANSSSDHRFCLAFSVNLYRKVDCENDTDNHCCNLNGDTSDDDIISDFEKTNVVACCDATASSLSQNAEDIKADKDPCV